MSLEPVIPPTPTSHTASLVATFGRYWHRLSPLIGIALFGVAVLVLSGELRKVPPRELGQTMRQVPATALALAGLYTFLNYLILTGYDQLAFRYIRVPIARWQIAMASFVGYAIANNVGFALLSGTSARYRFYSRWGLSGEDISRVVLFYSGTFWLGLIVVGGWALAGGEIEGLDTIASPLLAQAAGWLLLGTALAYPLFAALRRTPIRVAGVEIAIPSLGLVTAQFVLSILDWALAAAVLYALLPEPRPEFLFFLGAFLAAQLVALVSHVPGGLGVFESLMILMLQLPAAAVLPALALFRVIYYLVPLAVALVVLIVDEASQRRHQVVQWGNAFGTLTGAVAPKLLAVFAMLSGALLLASGATPAEPQRIAQLAGLVPLPVMELAHFAATVVGALLLVIAWGLSRRLAAASDWGLMALAAGVAASVLKGLDYEAAVVLAALAGALFLSRDEFDRRTPLLDVPFSPGWLLTTVGVLAGFVSLGLFVFRHVDYAPALWWRFDLQADMSRFLRASIGVGAVLLTVGVRHVMRPPRPPIALPSPADLDRAAAIIATAPRRPAPLALLGDKALLWDDTRTAFLMYGVQGSTWIALGDPVGPSARGERLVQRFLEKCDDYEGLPAVCEASKDWLHVYADYGLTSVRLADEARVFLPHFALEGSGQRKLRTTLGHLVRGGASMRVLEPAEAARHLPALRVISDAWLTDRGVGERGFAFSYFDEAYVRRWPIAVVDVGGSIQAFAVLWPDRDRDTLTIDTVRHHPAAPRGFMDGLLAWLLVWARQHGYRWCSLGVAPVAGVEQSETAPFWMRLGRYAVGHGDGPYNFRSLREYKRKFDPVWEPRYLVYPGGTPLPTMLADVTALIARGTTSPSSTP